MALTICTLVSLAVWVHLLAFHGRFWLTDQRLPGGVAPVSWPSVAAVVPARDEAAVLPTTLPSLVAQRYPGPFRVVLVDDDSSDGTGTIASGLGAQVVRGSGPPDGWVGKVAAMSAGVQAAGDVDYLLFTDADISYPPTALESLVRSAESHTLDLTSQMVRLRAESGWERMIVPAFVYFFAQLYPFRRVNQGRTAAAAGGCMLVRRSALEAAGGLVQIRDAVIDDVALGSLLARNGRIWLGLSADVESVREYPRLADLWDMVARSAYTQLRYSPAVLAGTVAGLLAVYVAPPVLTVVSAVLGDGAATIAAALAWALMVGSQVPMLRFYRLSPARALLLPVIATMYLGMTLDSARRHRAGRGATWKGRVAAG